MEICNKTYWVTGSSQSSPCQLNLRLTTWLRLLESLQSSSRRLARRKSSWMRRAAVYGAIWTPGHVSRTGRDGTNSGDCDSAIRPPMIMGQFWLEILASSQPLDTVGDWTLLINGDLHSQTSLRWPKIWRFCWWNFGQWRGFYVHFQKCTGEFSNPRWDNLPSGHQRYQLLGINLWYMYWGQKHSSE